MTKQLQQMDRPATTHEHRAEAKAETNMRCLHLPAADILERLVRHIDDAGMLQGKVGMQRGTSQRHQRERAAQARSFSHLQRILCLNLAFAVERVRVNASLQILEGGVKDVGVDVKAWGQVQDGEGVRLF